MSFPRLYPIVDADVAGRHGWTVPDLARAFLDGGATLLQIRAKQAGGAALLAMCEAVVALARPYGARVVVNDRADIAVLAGADGVHVGQEDLPVTDIRRAFPGLLLVGVSTHTGGQIEAAAAQPASYLAVGPVFPTTTKDTGYDQVGLNLVRRAREALTGLEAGSGEGRALVAIGGITLDRAPLVWQAGATSVAVISDLLTGNDPAGRVRAFLNAR